MNAAPTAPPALLAPATRTPHLLVCTLADGQAAQVLEQGLSLHRALGGTWSALTIEAPGAQARAVQSAVHAALRLAQRAGAATCQLGSAGAGRHELAAAVAQRARSEGATVLLVGTPRRATALWRSDGDALSRLVEDLGALLPGMWIHAVAPPRQPAPARVPTLVANAGHDKPWLRGWSGSLAMLVASTLLALLLEPWLAPASLIHLYLLGVVWVAWRHGGPAAMLATVGSAVVFDLMVVPPRWSFKPTETHHYVTFIVILLMGLVVSELAARLHRQAAMAEGRAQRNQALMQFAQRLLLARTPQAIGKALVDAAQEVSGRACWWCEAQAGKLPEAEPASPAAAAHAAVVQAAWQQATEAGAGTAVLGDASVRCWPIAAGPQVLGVLGMSLHTTLRSQSGRGIAALPPVEDLQLLAALADQAAGALERAGLDERSARAEWAAQSERLRNTLLAGLSHDLRTPLTTVIGALASLLDAGPALAEAQRHALLRLALAEASRTHTLTANLLQLTSLQEGAVAIQPQWCPADELLSEALQGLDVGRARITADLSPDAVLWCDPTLLIQALHNLLGNALRHAGPLAHVQVQLQSTATQAQWCVRDDGPGLPEAIVQGGPQRFCRGQPEPDEGRVRLGTGLGLALVAAIAQLHGGQLLLANDGGACCTLQLPQPQPQQQPQSPSAKLQAA